MQLPREDEVEGIRRYLGSRQNKDSWQSECERQKKKRVRKQGQHGSCWSALIEAGNTGEWTGLYFQGSEE